MGRRNYYVKTFLAIYKKFISSIFTKKSETNSLYVTTSAHFLLPLVKSLKDNSTTQLRVLNDICVVDYPEKTERFELNYNLLSVKYNFRVFLKAHTSNYIQSLSHLFNSANWTEREC